jgi:DNA helicase HerA-like ATPase
MPEPLPVARTPDGRALAVDPKFANRHGLIAGATGTGKTVTLQVLAERFSNIGVPVVVADVKGDLSGLAAAGTLTPKFQDRLTTLGFAAPEFRAAPVAFWDVFGKSGHPVRATVSDMGPLLLGRLLNLNETQRGVLTLVFTIADDAGLLLLDLKDLRAMLQFAADHASELRTQYGNMSAASIGAIQRGLVALEAQGADAFFGEPMLDVEDLLQTAADGRGVINILAADALIHSPAVYSTFLLWMLSELFEQLPEIGDRDSPRVVFFFDEAHLLFDDAPDALVDKIEQVVRLIRSKGVGVYFVTQNPLDIPEKVLGQLGNRVQHALRAFTPRDEKAVKAAARTMRQNPALVTEQVIMELAVGEGLVSFLEAGGTPAIVERAWILPPATRIGPVTAAERAQILDQSVVKGHYERSVDRESAYERLKARTEEKQQTAPAPPPITPQAPSRQPTGGLADILFGTTGPRGGRREGMIEAAAKSAARSMGSAVSREIFRGMLGTIFGGRRRR